MKKIIFAFLSMCTVSAYAQQGTILKYGDIGLDVNNNQNNSNNSSATGTVKSTNFHVLPGFGYQFTKHLTAGLQGGYSSDKNATTTPSLVYYNYNYPSTTTTTIDHSWSAGVFGRYTEYVGKVFFMIAQLNLGYIGDKTKVTDPNQFYVYPGQETTTATTQNGFAASFFPGVGAFIGKGWALNFNIGGIGYTYMGGEGGAVKNSHFGFDMGHQVNLGVSCNMSSHMHKHHHASGDDVHSHESKESKDDNDD